MRRGELDFAVVQSRIRALPSHDDEVFKIIYESHRRVKRERREGVNEAEANATVRDKNNSLGLVICSYFDLSCHVCFFAFQVRLFHLQTCGRSTTRNIQN